LVLKKINEQNIETIQILDENDTNQFGYDDHWNNKTSDDRTIFHLVCESGVYKFINNCFNKLYIDNIDALRKQSGDINDDLPYKLAKKNRLKNKYDVFFYLNSLDDQNNTIFHILVYENRMIALRLILEYASDNAFIDTIGFGLKNNENKTCFELAVELKNSEAIYLINHYELIDKSLNSNKYPSIIEPSFSVIKDKIKNFMNLDKKSIYEPNVVTNLIFQGGGVKGIAYVDALQESVKNGIFNLNNIKRVGGTSAGAITAVLLGVGYNLKEIENILNEFNFSDMLDSNESTKQRFFNLLKSIKNFTNDTGGTINKLLYEIWMFQTKDPDDLKIGYFPGLFFLKWIEEKISKKLGIKFATFKDLNLLITNKYQEENSKQPKLKTSSTQTEKEHFKSIFLTGSNLTTGKIEIFSHLHTPDMIISDAVRISMSIPYFFYPHQFYIKTKNIDNIIVEKNTEPEEFLRIVDPNKKYIFSEGKNSKVVKKDIFYVDGGLLYNYPINMFDSKRINDNIESNYINNQTLGFRIVSEDSKYKYESGLLKKFDELEEEKKKDNKKIFDLTKNLMNFFYKNEERSHSEKDQERTIYIDSKGIDSFDFEIKPSQIQELRNSGKEAISDYLNRVHNKKSNVNCFFKFNLFMNI